MYDIIDLDLNDAMEVQLESQSTHNLAFVKAI